MTTYSYAYANLKACLEQIFEDKTNDLNWKRKVAWDVFGPIQYLRFDCVGNRISDFQWRCTIAQTYQDGLITIDC